MKKLLALSIVVSAFAFPVSAPAQIKDALRRLTGGEAAEKQIAYFKIKGPVTETPVRIPPLFGSEPPQSLKGLLERFKEARLDNDVVAVVVDLQSASLGLAQLQEIHEALGKFAAVDKEVFIHADTLRTGTYAVSTGASQISIVPTGDLWLIGLHGETPYIRGMLDKIGAIPDFEHCGDYKTGPEPLTRTGPSEESQRMSKWLLDGIFEDVVTLIAESRGFTEEKVRALIDNGPYSAEDALKAGLIDAVQHRQDFIASIKKRYGEGTKIVSDYGKKNEWEIPQDNIFAMFEFLMNLLNPTPKVYTEPSIAIVYVEGMIQTGSAESSPFGTTPGAFSTSIRRALDKAANEDSVKAVVLRVDSPGGSALASEIILDATRRVAKKKPLIVSMGNVAASGGYYVTCASDTIFADSGTITASIGVFGGKIVTTGMWEKLGINWHSQQRGAMAGMFSTATKFKDHERAKLRHYMDAVYETFKGHVTAARGDALTKPIDEIAGGRVFTGRQALALGLVDRIGGLDDAIKAAAQKANLGDYEIRVIPEPPGLLELLGGVKEDDGLVEASNPALRSLTKQPMMRAMLETIRRVDPQRAQAITRMLQGLDVLQNERVLALMPGEMVIR